MTVGGDFCHHLRRGAICPPAPTWTRSADCGLVLIRRIERGCRLSNRSACDLPDVHVPSVSVAGLPISRPAPRDPRDTPVHRCGMGRRRRERDVYTELTFAMAGVPNTRCPGAPAELSVSLSGSASASIVQTARVRRKRRPDSSKGRRRSPPYVREISPAPHIRNRSRSLARAPVLSRLALPAPAFPSRSYRDRAATQA